MEDDQIAPTGETQEYVCQRCGYHYHKQHDYAPFLCFRCTRFISKKVFSLMNQVVPPVSRSERTSD